MLIDSLLLFNFVYGLTCVWSSCLGPSLSVNLLHCITHLHNCGVCMTSGLHKHDRVSHYRFIVGWVIVSSVILRHSRVANVQAVQV